jgi:hypothetical protein
MPQFLTKKKFQETTIGNQAKVSYGLRLPNVKNYLSKRKKRRAAAEILYGPISKIKKAPQAPHILF